MPKGGARPGAGRPKGRKDNKTLEREAIQKAFDQRVLRAADRLFNAQLSAAEGVTFLFRRKRKQKGEDGKIERVTSPADITAYLEQHGAAESGEMSDGTYYFLAAERPSADAADRLLNRAMGKAKESVEHSGSVTVPGAVMFAIAKAPDADCRD